jgi:uncharacterized protein YjbJ (UPF0337 family)
MSVSPLAFALQLKGHHAALPLRRPFMAVTDRDRLDDSNEPSDTPDSVRDEAPATGQRVKGGGKKMPGDIADDRGLEKKGERENAAEIERQRKNDD